MHSTGENRVKMLLWVGTSRIAGRGLFTAKPITRGTRIIQYTGEKIPKAESDKRLRQGNHYIFQLNDRYDNELPRSKLRGIKPPLADSYGPPVWRGRTGVSCVGSACAP
jgi:hypothetical protein